MPGVKKRDTESGRKKSKGHGLRDRTWKRFLRGPDPTLLEELYVPALAEALRYDRCCAYFSSSVLSAAARGFGRLIERMENLGEQAPRPAVRLVVNEELSAGDVRAMTETGDLSRLEAALKKRFKTPKDLLERQRLAMLAWLVKTGLLEVRVGIMRRGEGIVHAKFGLMTDGNEDAVVFSGSGNESARGLLDNYERLEVSSSWEDPERYREYAGEFEALWKDRHAEVRTYSLPEALRLKLVKLAPKEAPIIEPSHGLLRQKTAMIWRFITEAPFFSNGGTSCDATAMVDLWPHQNRVVEETARAWPAGRLLCDEVGMGKTIEAILVLRRLMAGRGVRRVLILLPAGLLKQWQAELREKGGMVFPRQEGTAKLQWPDGREEKVRGLAEAFEQDVLLMSRETARTEGNLQIVLAATPWDLVILDESHAARRRKQEEGEYNSGTLLLNLLRSLQLRRKARGFLLLSATPMQTHPWEPWDLLSVLGEGGAWLAGFSGVRDYYEALADLRDGRCDLPTARKAAALISADKDFPAFPGDEHQERDESKLARQLAFLKPGQREPAIAWLRKGSPLSRRMHRNTKGTLRGYYEKGLLPIPPPVRKVSDEIFDFVDAGERAVYNKITRYVERRYEELEREKPGKGFVMTIYRRRASSSPRALEQSLERRKQGLQRIVMRRAYDSSLLKKDQPEALQDDDLPEQEQGSPPSAALPQDPQAAANEMQELDSLLKELKALGGRDTKRDRFFETLRRILEEGRPVLVFTEYTDTLDYLREWLVDYYGKGVGCYSGEGGKLFKGEEWKTVPKDTITRTLNEGGLHVLLCTDAASEGLNLQAAGAVVNYDLPWNPSKVEQRIGRIDRIGQRFHDVRVVNFFLKDSVDDQVYRALRTRCGLFEHFVGSMQPVLARARKMLSGQEHVDTNILDAEAEAIKTDPLAMETYLESESEGTIAQPQAISRNELEDALQALGEELGFRLKSSKESGVYEVSGPGFAKRLIACTTQALERHGAALPLSPLEPISKDLADTLVRAGERLPLVIGSFQQKAFRSSVAYWVGDRDCVLVESLGQLRGLLEKWNGDYPEASQWLHAEGEARTEAERCVRNMETRAERLESEALDQQVSAARIRLQRELGRYLVCVTGEAGDLNAVLHQQMSRDIATAQRLKKCLEKMHGYPEWSQQECTELEEFLGRLTENQVRARLLGNEIDAALEDPRWVAQKSV